MTGMKQYDCYRDGVLIASGNIRRIAQIVGRSPTTVGMWRWRPPKGVRMVKSEVNNG